MPVRETSALRGNLAEWLASRGEDASDLVDATLRGNTQRSLVRSWARHLHAVNTSILWRSLRPSVVVYWGISWPGIVYRSGRRGPSSTRCGLQRDALNGWARNVGVAGASHGAPCPVLNTDTDEDCSQGSPVYSPGSEPSMDVEMQVDIPFYPLGTTDCQGTWACLYYANLSGPRLGGQAGPRSGASAACRTSRGRPPAAFCGQASCSRARSGCPAWRVPRTRTGMCKSCCRRAPDSSQHTRLPTISPCSTSATAGPRCSPYMTCMCGVFPFRRWTCSMACCAAGACGSCRMARLLWCA